MCTSQSPAWLYKGQKFNPVSKLFCSRIHSLASQKFSYNQWNSQCALLYFCFMGKRPTLHEVELHGFFVLSDCFCQSVMITYFQESTTGFSEQSRGQLCALTGTFVFSITRNGCKQIIIIIIIIIIILQKHIQCT